MERYFVRKRSLEETEESCSPYSGNSSEESDVDSEYIVVPESMEPVSEQIELLEEGQQCSSSISEVGGDLAIDRYDFDPATPLPLNRDTRDYIIKKGPFQPKNIAYSKDPISGRSFWPQWYEVPEWSAWLEYSSKKQAAFCFYC